MSSFLLEKEKTKTFDENINKYSENTKSSIYAAKKSFEKFIQECKSEWEEERVRVLPHQMGKGQCSGSNKIQVETVVEIVWV